jgi:hypothetical protein
MAQEPLLAKAPNSQRHLRWRWWYVAIADYMLRNPGGTMRDCAAQIGRHENTISQIVSTDMFKEYLARRKEEYAKDHDFAIRSRVTQVAEASLDIILTQLQAKKDQIPLQRLESLATGALDRLGYGPKTSPQVTVDLSTNDNRQQTVSISGVSPQLLEEARAALRFSEQLKRGSSLAPPEPSQVEALEGPEDGTVIDGDVEILQDGGCHASITD